MQARDYKVDIIKFIGTLLVLLAHTSISGFLFEVRTFDVVMLVFASGLTLKFHGTNIYSYISYIWKRVKRLLIPSWIFLLFLLSLDWMLSIFGKGVLEYNVPYILKSFLFIGGIKPFWIIRVYLTIAIVSPLIIKIAESSLINKNWSLFMGGVLLINEGLGYYLDLHRGMVLDVLKVVFSYTLGYSIVVLNAKTMANGTKKHRYVLAFFCISTLLFWAISGFSTPNTMKYPPRSIYICYGCFISSIVYSVLSNYNYSERSRIRKVVIWVSNNSLFIYFWHIIPMYYLANKVSSALVQWIIYILFASVMTFLQNSVINKGKRCIQ